MHVVNITIDIESGSFYFNILIYFDICIDLHSRICYCLYGVNEYGLQISCGNSISNYTSFLYCIPVRADSKF